MHAYLQPGSCGLVWFGRVGLVSSGFVGFSFVRFRLVVLVFFPLVVLVCFSFVLSFSLHFTSSLSRLDSSHFVTPFGDLRSLSLSHFVTCAFSACVTFVLSSSAFSSLNHLLLGFRLEFHFGFIHSFTFLALRLTPFWLFSSRFWLSRLAFGFLSGHFSTSSTSSLSSAFSSMHSFPIAGDVTRDNERIDGDVKQGDWIETVNECTGPAG